jgi:FSR family fosmidomycin resistance protein-like MFS transporter
LYFVDVGGVSAGTAALVVLGWTLCGLIGDFLMIPLLERVSGLTWLRVSAALMLAAFPAFLLAGPLPAKVILLGLVALLKSGWYAVPEARLYAALPGKSGTAMAARSLVGLADSFIPLGLGAIAQAAGLGFTMWFLLAGPVALIVGLPRARLAPRTDDR